MVVLLFSENSRREAGSDSEPGVDREEHQRGRGGSTGLDMGVASPDLPLSNESRHIPNPDLVLSAGLDTGQAPCGAPSAIPGGGCCWYCTVSCACNCTEQGSTRAKVTGPGRRELGLGPRH